MANIQLDLLEVSHSPSKLFSDSTATEKGDISNIIYAIVEGSSSVSRLFSEDTGDNGIEEVTGQAEDVDVEFFADRDTTGSSKSSGSDDDDGDADHGLISDESPTAAKDEEYAHRTASASKSAAVHVKRYDHSKAPSRSGLERERNRARQTGRQVGEDNESPPPLEGGGDSAGDGNGEEDEDGSGGPAAANLRRSIPQHLQMPDRVAQAIEEAKFEIGPCVPRDLQLGSLLIEILFGKTLRELRQPEDRVPAEFGSYIVLCNTLRRIVDRGLPEYVDPSECASMHDAFNLLRAFTAGEWKLHLDRAAVLDVLERHYHALTGELYDSVRRRLNEDEASGNNGNDHENNSSQQEPPAEDENEPAESLASSEGGNGNIPLVRSHSAAPPSQEPATIIPQADCRPNDVAVGLPLRDGKATRLRFRKLLKHVVQPLLSRLRRAMERSRT